MNLPLSPSSFLQNTRLALQTRELAPWSKSIPWPIFLNDVLPYFSLAEPRENYRELLFSQLKDIVSNTSSLTEAGVALNLRSWSIRDPPIKFVAAPPCQLNHYGVWSVLLSG